MIKALILGVGISNSMLLGGLLMLFGGLTLVTCLFSRMRYSRRITVRIINGLGVMLGTALFLGVPLIF